MSVLIKGMEMPKSCKSCDLLQDYDGDMYCPLNNYLNFGDIENVPDYVMIGCPLSAQPEPQWIPCSERLPKKDGRYQVTRYDYVTNTEFIDILWYEKNLWWNRHSTGDYAVTAWMPLPEPWRENDDSCRRT